MAASSHHLKILWWVVLLYTIADCLRAGEAEAERVAHRIPEEGTFTASWGPKGEADEGSKKEDEQGEGKEAKEGGTDRQCRKEQLKELVESAKPKKCGTDVPENHVCVDVSDPSGLQDRLLVPTQGEDCGSKVGEAIKEYYQKKRVSHDPESVHITHRYDGMAVDEKHLGNLCKDAKEKKKGFSLGAHAELEHERGLDSGLINKVRGLNLNATDYKHLTTSLQKHGISSHEDLKGNLDKVMKDYKEHGSESSHGIAEKGLKGISEEAEEEVAKGGKKGKGLFGSLSELMGGEEGGGGLSELLGSLGGDGEGAGGLLSALGGDGAELLGSLGMDAVPGLGEAMMAMQGLQFLADMGMKDADEQREKADSASKQGLQDIQQKMSTIMANAQGAQQQSVQDLQSYLSSKGLKSINVSNLMESVRNRAKALEGLQSSNEDDVIKDNLNAYDLISNLGVLRGTLMSPMYAEHAGRLEQAVEVADKYQTNGLDPYMRVIAMKPAGSQRMFQKVFESVVAAQDYDAFTRSMGLSAADAFSSSKSKGWSALFAKGGSSEHHDNSKSQSTYTETDSTFSTDATHNTYIKKHFIVSPRVEIHMDSEKLKMSDGLSALVDRMHKVCEGDRACHKDPRDPQTTVMPDTYFMSRNRDCRDVVHEVFLRFGSHVCPVLTAGGWYQADVEILSSSEKTSVEKNNIADKHLTTAVSNSFHSGGQAGFLGFGGSWSNDNSDSHTTGNDTKSGDKSEHQTQNEDTTSSVMFQSQGGQGGLNPELWLKSLNYNSNWAVLDKDMDQCYPIWRLITANDSTSAGSCMASLLYTHYVNYYMSTQISLPPLDFRDFRGIIHHLVHEGLAEGQNCSDKELLSSMADQGALDQKCAGNMKCLKAGGRRLLQGVFQSRYSFRRDEATFIVQHASGACSDKFCCTRVIGQLGHLMRGCAAYADEEHGINMDDVCAAGSNLMCDTSEHQEGVCVCGASEMWDIISGRCIDLINDREGRSWGSTFQEAACEFASNEEIEEIAVDRICDKIRPLVDPKAVANALKVKLGDYVKKVQAWLEQHPMGIGPAERLLEFMVGTALTLGKFVESKIDSLLPKFLDYMLPQCERLFEAVWDHFDASCWKTDRFRDSGRFAPLPGEIWDTSGKNISLTSALRQTSEASQTNTVFTLYLDKLSKNFKIQARGSCTSDKINSVDYEIWVSKNNVSWSKIPKPSIPCNPGRALKDDVYELKTPHDKLIKQIQVKIKEGSVIESFDALSLKTNDESMAGPRRCHWADNAVNVTANMQSNTSEEEWPFLFSGAGCTEETCKSVEDCVEACKTFSDECVGFHFCEGTPESCDQIKCWLKANFIFHGKFVQEQEKKRNVDFVGFDPEGEYDSEVVDDGTLFKDERGGKWSFYSLDNRCSEAAYDWVARDQRITLREEGRCHDMDRESCCLWKEQRGNSCYPARSGDYFKLEDPSMLKKGKKGAECAPACAKYSDCEGMKKLSPHQKAAATCDILPSEA